jgi:hypothetical protein
MLFMANERERAKSSQPHETKSIFISIRHILQGCSVSQSPLMGMNGGRDKSKKWEAVREMDEQVSGSHVGVGFQVSILYFDAR